MFLRPRADRLQAILLPIPVEVWPAVLTVNGLKFPDIVDSIFPANVARADGSKDQLPELVLEILEEVGDRPAIAPLVGLTLESVVIRIVLDTFPV